MAEWQHTDLFGRAAAGLQGASHHLAGTGNASHRVAAPARHHCDEAFCRPPRDLTDIVALRPTPQELQFVRSELPRPRRIDQPRAARLESFLEQYHDDGP